jgi:hypothetical protein
LRHAVGRQGSTTLKRPTESSQPVVEHPAIGGPLPLHVAGYFADVDGGPYDELVEHFADGFVYSLPQGSEFGSERTILRTPRELTDWAHRRGPKEYVHEIYLAVSSGRHWLLEGIARNRHTGVPWVSIAVAAELAEDTRIRSWFAALCSPALPRIDALVEPSTKRRGTAQLRHWLDLVDAGDVDGAVKMLADDVVFSDPRCGRGAPGEERIVWRSPQAVRDALRAAPARGAHRVEHRAQWGPHLMASGTHTSPGAPAATFIVSLTFDSDDRLRRYVAHYCRPANRD